MQKTLSISNTTTAKVVSVTAIMVLCLSLLVIGSQLFTYLKNNSVTLPENSVSPQEQSLNQALDKLDSQVLH